MKLKIAFASIMLSLSPVVASAMCSSMAPEQTASVCAEGQVMDTQSGVCIDPVSS